MSLHSDEHWRDEGHGDRDGHDRHDRHADTDHHGDRHRRGDKGHDHDRQHADKDHHGDKDHGHGGRKDPDKCGCDPADDHGLHADGHRQDHDRSTRDLDAGTLSLTEDRLALSGEEVDLFAEAERFLQLSYDSLAQDPREGDGPNSLRSLLSTGILDEAFSTNDDGPLLATLDGSDAARGRAAGKPAEASAKVFDVFVEDSLACAVSKALCVYAADLEAEGYEVTIRPFSGTGEELRATLQERWTGAGLEGALFVGDLPTQRFDSEDNFGGAAAGTVTYPHDLYFMDLDGDYAFDAAGADAHTGDVGPEIYVSRLTASNLGGILAGTEADLINAYLQKVHDLRTGTIGYEDRAIWFADDDWSGTDPAFGLSGLYGAGAITGITDPADTTLARYTSVLGENAETLVEMLHSWPQGHQVSGTGGGFLTSADIVAANPQIGFLNMFNCSSADFTAANNLAGAYLFGSDRVVNLVGSTKTGSMLNFEEFYGPQAAGESVGAAFLAWFDANAAATDDPGLDWQVDWFYGMTMQGDPTLQPFAIA